MRKMIFIVLFMKIIKLFCLIQKVHVFNYEVDLCQKSLVQISLHLAVEDVSSMSHLFCSELITLLRDNVLQ